MPTPKPLTPEEARASLANRLTDVVDSARQYNTIYGLRSQRVFLVWTHWTGEARGDGEEHVMARVEILPTPRLSDLSAVMRRPYSIGYFPEGSVRVDEISMSFTYDQLTGLAIPGDAPVETCGGCCGPGSPRPSTAILKSGPWWTERVTRGNVDFFWESVEDGRGDTPPARFRYSVQGEPARLEGRVQWVVNLQRASEELSRQGKPQIGNDAQTINLTEPDY